MPFEPPPIVGFANLLARAFPALGSSDEGRAVAIRIADVADAIVSLAGARHGG